MYICTCTSINIHISISISTAYEDHSGWLFIDERLPHNHSTEFPHSVQRRIRFQDSSLPLPNHTEYSPHRPISSSSHFISRVSQLLIHSLSFFLSFIHSFIHSFIRFIDSFIRSCVSFIRSSAFLPYMYIYLYFTAVPLVIRWVAVWVLCSSKHLLCRTRLPKRMSQAIHQVIHSYVMII